MKVQSVLALAGGFADFEVYEVCGPVQRDTTPLLTLHPQVRAQTPQTCLKIPHTLLELFVGTDV